MNRHSALPALALIGSLARPVPAAAPDAGRVRSDDTRASDIVRCEMEVIPDLPTRRVSLRATLTIANPDRRPDFTFFLADWYSDVSVRSRNGAARYERADGAITVHVAQPEAEEQLVFHLAGFPGRSRGESRDVLGDSSIFLLWSDGFYPADFDDWMLLRGRITLPEQFRLLAPGRLTAGPAADGKRTWSFETSQPIRMATLVADPRWIESEGTVNGWQVRTLLYPTAQHWAEQIAATSSDVLGFYQSRFGPYAFDGFTFATVEGIFARRSVSGGVIYAPAYLDQEMRTTGHDAHETALLWWFGTTAGRGPGSYQWTEGFGDYAEFLYDEARGKPIPRDFELYRRGYLRSAGTPEELEITSPRGPLAGNFIHGRLPWVMHFLRFAIGDSAFARAHRLLFDRWRFRSFTLDEFVGTLAEGAGRPLDWWQREWLERRGVPELAWRFTVTPAGAQWLVTLAVEQTSELYHLPIEVGIETSEGIRYERVHLEDRSAEFRFPTSSEPTRVTLDPRGWLLAKVTRR